MKLTQFVPGAAGFNAAVKSGAAVALNPVESLVVGAGLPIWPVYALKQVATALPDADVLAERTLVAIRGLMPVARLGGAALTTMAAVGGALVPVAQAVGAAAAPALSAIPYAGPALGVAAANAGPIVAVGSVAGGAAGAIATGAPDPEMLGNLGRQVAEQLNQLDATNTADAIIDVPQKV